jgi:putative membrane protein
VLKVKRTAYALALVLLVVCCVFAHGDKPHDADELWSAWSFDPLVVILLLFSATVYTIGVLKLWHESEIGSAISIRGACFYALGWLSLVVALVSPIHSWGEVLFSAHMTQHEILMLISAPLIVLGRPLIAAMWTMPRATRLRVGSTVKNKAISNTWEFFTGPTVAFIVHGLALWVWHIPFLFQATLESDLVHTLQHASFLGSALLFWWAIVYGKRGVASYGAGVLYLFVTSIHSGVLGAFLTFTKRVWYPIYEPTTAQWGLSPLEDQQLGGLIMWVPAGVVYIVAALFMFAAWIKASERIAVRNKTRRATPAAAEA